MFFDDTYYEWTLNGMIVICMIFNWKLLYLIQNMYLILLTL